MNILLFIIILIFSVIAVRIGAIAFQVTGLEWSLAKFQALSCFTGTGFTTRESELITSNIKRRKIASTLMVLGNAGLVTLIATFVNTLRPNMITPGVTVSFMGIEISRHIVPWLNLTIIGISLYIVIKVFTHTNFANRFTQMLSSRILENKLVKSVSFEELLVSTGGYGVSNIEVCDKSPVAGKTIIESGIRKHDITILVVARKKETIPNPRADTEIKVGDRLICFGKLDVIRKELCLV